MNCQNCGIEFTGRAGAKFCSSKCRKEAFLKRSIGTDNGTFIDPKGTDKFEFTVKVGDWVTDKEVIARKNTVRTAFNFEEVPISAIPIIKKGWPQMPEWMNGRQYFLWFKNDFKNTDTGPQLLNPYPKYDNVVFVDAGKQSRRWGA